MPELTVIINAVAALVADHDKVNDSTRIKTAPYAYDANGPMYLYALTDGWVYGRPIGELV